ncbi:unnamed protein product [Adineta steineri]|uniref:Uncharacterized protein n=1 Tax=Adineta steineri TaxID=433720 RepID=A0A819EC70_9BILA|nr:unnamed protein product [Adineta steineri]CAF3848140.1 unnamed protein product [Adineta steineri]
MNFLVIILSFILFFGINSNDTDDTSGIDVLDILKEKQTSCDLHDFVIGKENSEKEYIALVYDLATYCSETESTSLSRILCRMILIELEIGCSLPNKSRPTPVKYINSYTSTQICSMNKIMYTNRWIWNKFTEKEKEELGASSAHICPKLTSVNSTLRLTRFFYKIAPRIRRAEALSTNLTANKSEVTNVKNIKKDSVDAEQPIADKPDENKEPVVVDSKKKESKSNIRQRQNEKRKQLIDNDDYGDDDDNAADVKKNKDTKNKEDDGKEIKSSDEVNDKKDDTRVKREKEEVKERRKPQAPDSETGFQLNEREKEWVGGKKDDNQPNWSLKKKNRIDSDDKSSHTFSKRRRISLRSKSNNDHDDDNSDEKTSNFTTYFLIFILLIVATYFTLQYKNKAIGIIIEGCKQRRGVYGRRTGGSGT